MRGSPRTRRSSRTASRCVAVVVSVTVALAGCAVARAGTGAAPRPPVAAGSSSDAAAGVSAVDALLALPVRGRAPRTGYERDAFGDGWVDLDHNGCDTRNDVLARDLREVVFVPGTRDCVVATGLLVDPYSQRSVPFVRGQGTSDAVQVDHVVALSDAWQKGAQRWTGAQRADFANDPLNLLAVDGPLNAAKGDGDAATWLPPDAGYRCAYVARQVAVKAAHGLWVTAAERDAVAGVLAACPGEPLPARLLARADGPLAPTAGPVAPTADPAGTTYADCAAVRAAGAAPVHRGDPGYAPALDRDGDGTGCEP